MQHSLTSLATPPLVVFMVVINVTLHEYIHHASDMACTYSSGKLYGMHAVIMRMAWHAHSHHVIAMA